MANEEQVAILKQGVDIWNRWREKNPDVEIDLSGADFSSTKELQAALDRQEFFKIDDVTLNLSGINFGRANLKNIDFFNSNLSFSNLRYSDLDGAKFNGANLAQADFTSASLMGTDFTMANLNGANFTNVTLGVTIFGDNNISKTIGLETILYMLPSTLGVNTIQKSKGKIPVEFLRGCGLSDLDIEYAKLSNPELTAQEVSEITQKIFDIKDTRPIQISPLFISYSHANMPFVERLETKLTEKGIRFWRDVHDATSGRLETQINRAIRHNPTVLLILSKNSTQSDWVEHEARLARKLEKEIGRDVLCPIALDDSWKTCNWPERIKEQIMEYNILDFSKWENDAAFSKMFTKLIDGLDMFYRKVE